MGWFFVLLASACEIGGTIGLNMFSKKKQFTTGILFVGGFALSFFFFIRLVFFRSSIRCLYGLDWTWNGGLCLV
ncbi:hypothetical protein BsIDN1_15440 [Bacillus safensis]|uniref:QacE family quaternary ammonium compound efflux SMR transporter n=1 Tax=Bacillus safensis TaxID=561879 RepID=A0A5S9M8Q5_BACIA|nr:hypothetical protein BsIDN1_15440 [Bacillus safensis]